MFSFQLFIDNSTIFPKEYTYLFNNDVAPFNLRRKKKIDLWIEYNRIDCYKIYKKEWMNGLFGIIIFVVLRSYKYEIFGSPYFLP